ncbi:PE-PGRS family protein [Streptomyces sp. NPDC020983]|uniref:PE-PGRS family protein n=1 Tax=Streptomyces sp. NPDC020983 TaxID=3365106 RepID=UPI0037B2DA07
MRSVNPEDLEQLATLLDGADSTSLKNATDAVFRAAATLNVTSKLTPLRPMAAWATETAPDLRRRAARTRLGNGDLTGGLLWAGFTPADLRTYQGPALDPETVLIADSVANSDDPRASLFHRRPDENLETYLDRLRATALTSIPGLQPFEPAVEYLIGAYGDWKSVTDSAGHVIVQGTALTKVLLGNSFKQGWGREWKDWAARSLNGMSSERIQKWGEQLDAWEPRIRSLAAPGTWLPSRITAGLQRIPFTGGWIGDRTGERWDRLRRLPFMNSQLLRENSVNSVIDFLVGSDELAARFGGRTHAGVDVVRAGQADLIKVGWNAAKSFRIGEDAAAASRTTSLLRATGTMGRTAGLLRGLGIGASAASTVMSGLNVWSDGNPAKAFRREGAGYVADVAELGFNASMTAAMISPNPFTLGAVVVFGSVYGGAEIYQHWDDITKGMGKAVDWTGDTAKKAGHEVAGEAKKAGHEVAKGAKSVAKACNPLNW